VVSTSSYFFLSHGWKPSMVYQNIGKTHDKWTREGKKRIEVQTKDNTWKAQNAQSGALREELK
jgi:hypothetical protein